MALVALSRQPAFEIRFRLGFSGGHLCSFEALAERTAEAAELFTAQPSESILECAAQFAKAWGSDGALISRIQILLTSDHRGSSPAGADALSLQDPIPDKPALLAAVLASVCSAASTAPATFSGTLIDVRVCSAIEDRDSWQIVCLPSNMTEEPALFDRNFIEPEMQSFLGWADSETMPTALFAGLYRKLLKGSSVAQLVSWHDLAASVSVSPDTVTIQQYCCLKALDAQVSLSDYDSPSTECYLACELAAGSESAATTTLEHLWALVSYLCTCICPDRLLISFGLASKASRTAWREKVALCFVILGLCSAMLFFVIGLTTFLCPEQRVMTFTEFEEASQHSPHCIVHGIVYSLAGLPHSQNDALPSHIFASSGKDVSHLFPRPSTSRACKGYYEGVLFALSPGARLGGAKKLDKSLEAKLDKELGKKSGSKHSARPAPTTLIDGASYVHSITAFERLLGRKAKYFLGFSDQDLEKHCTSSSAYVSINGRVYDVTGLSAKQDSGLSPLGIEGVSAPWGTDKTKKFRHPKATNDLRILNSHFVGVVDIRQSQSCKSASYILIGSSAMLVIMMVFKFLAALQLGLRSRPEAIDKFVIIQVPCYTENEESLRKTIDSLATLQFDSKRKLLFIVADGLVIGSGNDRPTAQILLDIFGLKESLVNLKGAKAYYSVGAGALGVNYAKIYSGMYECSGQRMPYILVVKTGRPSETYRPGNRGKRDSQIILLRFLSKVHSKQPMTPLELELYRHIDQVVGIDPFFYEYVMMVDADTEVMPQALNHMLSKCIHDGRIMGICGETRLSNETASAITMLQVYEYFISHNLTKAFESLFGCVTCLPGCFCMYRIRTGMELGGVPLVIDEGVLDCYARSSLSSLHEKNLLALGEDRYLTTLMLKRFPTFKLKFTPEATCMTAAPETWSVLLSQRRRWINSTIHNLFELLLLPDLCGFCFFSMRFVVFIDLFGTLVMPASVIYICYLIYQALQYKTAPTISLFLMATVYGIQSIIFVLRKQWQYIGWLLIHIASIPVTGFIIPLYAYWHFDDFSWGSTRRTFDPRLDDKAAREVEAAGSTERLPRLPMKLWQASPSLAVQKSAPLPPHQPQPVDAQIHEMILQILANSDLTAMSRKQIRMEVSRRLQLPEQEWRRTINAVLDSIIDSYN